MKIIKFWLILFTCLFIASCAEYKIQSKSKKKEKLYFSSSGFALIYADKYFLDNIVSKKLDNNDFRLMHSFLKVNTPIKIINPINSKFIETKVFKKGNYPSIFNSVINKKIAIFLDLNPDSPFVEIIELKKNIRYVAKEGNTFDEEKNVAEKVPVVQIEMDNLTDDQNTTQLKKIKEQRFFLIISDFYYLKSANILKNKLSQELSIKNMSIKKLNNNTFRLLVGPFKNFNALKTTYISLNNFGFETLNVYSK